MSDSARTSRGTALVTGATGFVGSHLVRALDAAGWTVRACGRRARPGWMGSSVDYRRLDLVSGAGVDGSVDGATHLFHLAGASSSTSTPEEMQRVNVDGTANLLEAAAEAGVERVLHMSTSSVYGKEVALPQPVPEDVQPHPGAGYAASKWEGEEVAVRQAKRGLAVTVVRPTTVYGPGAVKLVASTILDAAIERHAGLTEFAVPRQPVELRLVHVDDVVDACLHLATHADAVGCAFNLTSGTYPSSHDVAEVVARELGLDLVLSDEHDPGLSHDERAATHRRMVEAGMVEGIMFKSKRIRFLRKANPNNRLSLKALRSTGFEPQVTDLSRALPAAIDWYRQRRWII